MITKKPPNALKFSKYVIENKISLAKLSKSKMIFKGSATEGAKAFPANVNVAAAVGLAGIGPDKTNLEIWADPKLSRNTHKVVVKSDSADFEIKIKNVQSRDNPGTGKITALSVIACLKGYEITSKVRYLIPSKPKIFNIFLAYYLHSFFMDPVSILSVFLKVAVYLPNQQINNKEKIIHNISRTELIEIYRNDMKNNNNVKNYLNLQ